MRGDGHADAIIDLQAPAAFESLFIEEDLDVAAKLFAVRVREAPTDGNRVEQRGPPRRKRLRPDFLPPPVAKSPKDRDVLPKFRFRNGPCEQGQLRSRQPTPARRSPERKKTHYSRMGKRHCTALGGAAETAPGG